NTKTDCLFIALQKEIEGLLNEKQNYLTDNLTTEEKTNLIKAVDKVYTKVPELVKNPWFNRAFKTQWNLAKDDAEKLKLLTEVFKDQEKAVPLLRQLAVYEITWADNIFADPKSAAGPLPFDDGLLKDYSVSLETTYEIFKDIYNTRLAESSKLTESSKEVNDETKDQALVDTCEAKEIKDSEFMLYPDLKKSFIENAKKSSTFDVGVKSEWEKRSARTFFQALATNTQGYKSYGGDIEAKAIGQLLGLDIGITNVNLKLEGNRMKETFGKTGGQPIELVYEPGHWETVEELEDKKKMMNMLASLGTVPSVGSGAPITISAGGAELNLKTLFDAINDDTASKFTLEKFAFTSIAVGIKDQKGIVIEGLEAIKKASPDDLKELQSAHCVFKIDADKSIEYRFEKNAAGVIIKNEYLINDAKSAHPDDFLPNFKAMVAIAVAGGHEKLDLSPLTKNLPAYVACLVACQEKNISTVPNAGQIVINDAGLLNWYNKTQPSNPTPPLVATPQPSKKMGSPS
ncbi:MAG: hypothetical protein KJ588_03145, partial [Gammaproteobacteria bacterium]|nr:hypothetical protein [Gammaproteobacteria bacterium]